MKLRAFSEDDLLKCVNQIKKFASVKKANRYTSGKIIFYIEDYLDRESGYYNTTVEDILAVCGNDFKITAMGNFDCTDTLQVVDMRIASKKDFRGVIKFTPKNTLKISIATLNRKGYDGKELSVFKLPVVQNAKKIISLKKESNIEELINCYNVLSNNKTLSCNSKNILPKDYCDNVILTTHLLISNYYEIVNSWFLAYEFQEATYLIPVDIEDLKEALKNREKEEGRKSVLPTVVSSYETKNGKHVGAHIRMSDDGFYLFGEKFYYVIGSDALKLAYHNNNYGKRKLRRDIRESKGYSYPDNDALLINKKGTGMVVQGNNYEKFFKNIESEE